MQIVAQTDLPPGLASPARPLAAVGVFLASLGLLMAVGAPAFIDASERPRQDLPHVLAESANKIKDRLSHKAMDVQSQRSVSWKGALAIGGALVGFFGSALGTASWARRENSRMSSVAIAGGLTAIAWNYFIVAAAAAVALFLLAWVVSHFHR